MLLLGINSFYQKHIKNSQKRQTFERFRSFTSSLFTQLIFENQTIEIDKLKWYNSQEQIEVVVI